MVKSGVYIGHYRMFHRVIADELAYHVAAAGYDVLLDTRVWTNEMVRNTGHQYSRFYNTHPVMIVILSGTALYNQPDRSHDYLSEDVGAANERGALIIPVLLNDGTDYDNMLKDRLYILTELNPIYFRYSHLDALRHAVAQRLYAIAPPDGIRDTTLPASKPARQQLVGEWLFEKANVALRQRRYHRALQRLDHALVLLPDHFPLSFARMRALIALKRYPDALQESTRAARLSPKKYYWVHGMRGVIHHYMGEYEAALAAFDTAIALRANSSMMYNNRAMVHYIRGQYDLAIQDASHAIAFDASHPLAYITRGNAHLAKCDYVSAYPDFKRHIEVTGRLDAVAIAGQAIASFHMEGGDQMHASMLLQELFTRYPQYAIVDVAAREFEWMPQTLAAAEIVYAYVKNDLASTS